MTTRNHELRALAGKRAVCRPWSGGRDLAERTFSVRFLLLLAGRQGLWTRQCDVPVGRLP